MAKIIFCNYKIGSPIGHSFGKDNFFVYPDGNCYGYVEFGNKLGKYKKLGIENIDPSAKRKKFISDVTVVFCAKLDENAQTSICGWYRHATVYREHIDGEQPYYFEASADNVYAVPESERTFLVPRASNKKCGFGIGQINIWYAAEENAQGYVDSVMQYIQETSAKKSS